jgi:hypothetical protein
MTGVINERVVVRNPDNNLREYTRASMKDTLIKTYSLPDYSLRLVYDLIAPARLVITIAVFGEPADIGAVRAHNINLTAGCVPVRDVVIGAESDPFTIRRKTFPWELLPGSETRCRLLPSTFITKISCKKGPPISRAIRLSIDQLL